MHLWKPDRYPAADPKSESEELVMKKVFCLMLALCMVLALAACGGKTRRHWQLRPCGHWL